MIKLFPTILPPPRIAEILSYRKQIIDPGDAHVLASAHESKADYLVTLDKKHILILQKKIRWVSIVSPEQLLEQGLISSGS